MVIMRRVLVLVLQLNSDSIHGCCPYIWGSNFFMLADFTGPYWMSCFVYSV